MTKFNQTRDERRTASPSARLNFALSAASRALNSEGEERTRQRLWAIYLSLLIEHLTGQGVDAAHLAPLAELREEKLALGEAPRRERREGRSASEELLARVCAVIDLLVKSGYSEEEAAQKVMRQLLSVGLLPPSEGGDARGWKRMLVWRIRFQRGDGSDLARSGYAHCRDEIEAIPAPERVERVLRQRLWDRRQGEPARPSAA